MLADRVPNPFGDYVTSYLAGNSQAGGTFPVDLAPQGIVFDGVNMWVSNRDENTVTKLRASDGVGFGTFATVSSPFSMVFDGTN
jgi:hypothetical protein